VVKRVRLTEAEESIEPARLGTGAFWAQPISVASWSWIICNRSSGTNSCDRVRRLRAVPMLQILRVQLLKRFAVLTGESGCNSHR
jgi:hypothetical protein